MVQLTECTFAGEVLTELHGKVPEDEPTRIAAIPRIPDDRQRECTGHGPEDEQAIRREITR